MRHYTSQGIVYRLKVHIDALSDLADIGDAEPEAEATILALLQEIKGSQHLLESLTIKDFGSLGNEKISVDMWGAQQKAGRNLWRLKAWDLEKQGLQYRVIYCLDSRNSTNYVLAVLPRDWDYKPDDPRTIKLLKVYDSIGIPSY